MERFTRLATVLTLSCCLTARAAEIELPPDATLKPDPEPSLLLARFGARTRFQHDSTATSVCWTGDGNFIVSSHYDGSLRLWDPQTGAEIRRLTGHKGHVYEVAVSCDGRLAASVGTDTSVRIWELRTGKELHCGRHAHATVTVAFAPDGKTLASGDASGNIHVWEVKTGKRLHHIVAHRPENCAEIRFSPDGKEFVSCGFDKRVCRWETETGKLIEEFNPLADALAALDYSPDGKYIAVGSIGGSMAIRGVEAKKVCKKFEVANGSIYCVCFTDKGLALGGGRGVDLQLLDIETGKARSLDLSDPRCDVRGIAVAPHGNVLVAAGELGVLKRYDLQTLKPIGQPPEDHRGPVACVSFAPTGESIAWGGPESPTVQLTSVSSGQRLLAATQSVAGISALKASQDSKTIAFVDTAGLIHLVDATTGKPVASFNRDRRDAHDRAASLAISPDGKHVEAISVLGGLLHQLNSHGSLDNRATPLRLNAPPECLLLSPDGTRLARLASQRSGFGLFSVPDLKELVTMKKEECFTEVAGCFSPEGNVLATVEKYGVVRIWNARTGALLGSWKIRDDRDAWLARPVRAMAISPDGRTLAVCRWSDEPAQAQEAVPLPAGVRKVNVLDLDIERALLKVDTAWQRSTPPDETFSDLEIGVYEVGTQRLRATLHGHADAVLALALSPDSRLLASGSKDQSCILWDLTGRKIAGLPDSAQLTEPDFHPLWNSLKSDNAPIAWRDAWTLVAGGDATVAFLKHHLEPIEAATPQQIAKLIARLDAENFDQRETASKALALLGHHAEDALQATLDTNPSLEVQRRAGDLLAHLGPTTRGERLRYLRAIEILEHIATPGARRLLEKLASGSEDDSLTMEARAALERLTRGS